MIETGDNFILDYISLTHSLAAFVRAHNSQSSELLLKYKLLIDKCNDYELHIFLHSKIMEK